MTNIRRVVVTGIGLIAACASVKVAVRFVAMTASQSSRFMRITS